MGKEETEAPVRNPAQGEGRNLFFDETFRRVRRWFSWKCVIILLFSVAVLLAALLFVVPYLKSKDGFDSTDWNDLTAPIQAVFNLERPPSELASNIKLLEMDILGEIGVPDTKVSIESLHSIPDSNKSYVVFGVLPISNTTISPWGLSLLRSSFVSLILKKSNLSLSSVFGETHGFELLRFPGGITVVPSEHPPLWRKPHTLFNFTLNDSVSHIQKNLNQLLDELKLGLHLLPNENVFVKVTNLNGSSLCPPVVVQSSVMTDLGRHLERPRLRDLARTITRPVKNLGLNHTVFGNVKQISLSAYLKHSLGKHLAPSPAPSPSQISVDVLPPVNSPSEPPYPALSYKKKRHHHPVTSHDHPSSPPPYKHDHDHCPNCHANPPTGEELPPPPARETTTYFASPPIRSPCLGSSNPSRPLLRDSPPNFP